jgi:hypothetical protein
MIKEIIVNTSSLLLVINFIKRKNYPLPLKVFIYNGCYRGKQ